MVTTTLQSNTTFPDNHSPGCQLCQKGKWLCIFITYLCNAACKFCPAPLHLRDTIVSAFGEDPYQILENIKERNINGFSFSGGDSFLAFDRMLEWLKIFKSERPEIYYWAYTNGLSAHEKKMRLLAEAGLHELRFNIAATGYNNAGILKSITRAAQIFNAVAVEIPSVPADFHRLTTVLPLLNQAGVKYLNLHEYILEPGDPARYQIPTDVFLLNRETELVYDPASLQNTKNVRDFCRDNGLSLKINNCSLQKKNAQMWKRRMNMGEVHRKAHEKVTDDGLLATFLVTPEIVPRPVVEELLKKGQFDLLEPHCVHPDKPVTNGTHNQVVTKLLFNPPLDLQTQRRLNDYEIVE